MASSINAKISVSQNHLKPMDPLSECPRPKKGVLILRRLLALGILFILLVILALPFAFRLNLRSQGCGYFTFRNHDSCNSRSTTVEKVTALNVRLRKPIIRVFVYELPSDLNLGLASRDPRCLKHMFATEIYFHWSMVSSPMRTRDPSKANWFYVPVYSTSYLVTSKVEHRVYPDNFGRLMNDSLNYVKSNFPYWNRSNGADHFMIFPHDYGSCFHFMSDKAAENGIPENLGKATLVQTFGHRNHSCMREGSVIIPPFVSSRSLRLAVNSSMNKRDIFAYFRGTKDWSLIIDCAVTYSQGARQKIFQLYENHSLFNLGESSSTYFKDLQRSVFCLCPRGWAPWSPRFVEAVFFECIPVIIADDIVLPFESSIPWDSFAVFVPENKIDKLDTILTSISEEDIRRRQEVLSDFRIKNAMLFTNPSESYDAFHRVMYELALKLHNRA